MEKHQVTDAQLDSMKIFAPDLMKGKVILMTGGSNGGMISETARAYLRHGAAAVALFARKAEQLNAVAEELSKSTGGVCIGIPGDVRKPESCKNAVDIVVQKFGRLDVLINGAAGNFLASASKISTNGFRTVLEIDTLGTFNMSQAAFKGFMGENGGVIINITASLHWNGTALQAHASAAKAGVDALTKVLACEWGPHRIRVVGMLPGAIENTEGFARLGNPSLANNKEASKAAFAKTKESGSNGGAFGEEAATTKVPLLRFGKVQDVANSMLFLASPAASYMTGTILNIDGGAYLIMPNMTFGHPEFVQKWKHAKL